MKPYVLRRLKGMSDPLPTEKPRLFSTKGYLTDLDSMIQKEYSAALGDESITTSVNGMLFMLVELELMAKGGA